MAEDRSTKATRIDVATWERAALYELFSTYDEPFHGICVRVDCTEAFRFAKANGMSVFLTQVHRALAAANRVSNFKTRIVDGEVWQYATIHGGSAVGRPNGTIGFGHYDFHPDVLAFVREATVEVDRVRARTDLQRAKGQDLIRFSALPWNDFTSISHARDFGRPDSAPKITFGKMTETGGRMSMPASIHVHHALADGLHVAQFVEEFERCLREPELV